MGGRYGGNMLSIFALILAWLIPVRVYIFIDESGDALFTEANPGEVTNAVG